MDAAQWAKDVTDNGSYNEQVAEKKIKPHHDQEALNCPRCNSTNTKFCYFNNYSLTQPRHFCKACKRYWTRGGSLRSVPVGGGSRKNKRSSISSSSSSSSSTPKPIDLSQFSSQEFTTHQQPTHEQYHLGFSQFLKLPKIENASASFVSSSLTSDGLNSFPTTDTTHSDSMFNGVQDFKPTLGFSFQGNGIKYGSFQGSHQEDGESERIMLPFGVLNQSRESGQSMGQGNSNGYWTTESLGGGSSTLYN